MTSPLKSALEGIKNAVTDVTTVQVRTYVGKIEHIVEAVEDTDSKTKSFDAILEATKDTGKFQLAYLSVLDLDGDALLFRPSDTTAAIEKAEEAHDSAVRSGLASRTAIIDTFKDFVGGLVD